MAVTRTAKWTPSEERVFARCVRGLREGRYAQVSDAAEACRLELAESRRRTPAAARPAIVRSLSSVYSRLYEAARGFWVMSSASKWTREELAIVDRHVGLLLKGRYPTLLAAAAGCRADLQGLRRAGDSGRAVVPRSVKAVATALARRAHLAGWRFRGTRWTPREDVVFKRHLALMMQGDYRDAWAAAEACSRELGRSRRSRRTVSAIFTRLSREAPALGWSRASVWWLPEERRILKRHARRLVRVGGPRVKQVASECCLEMDALHSRLRVEQPHVLRRVIPRKYKTVLWHLDKLAVELGRPISEEWQPDEDRIVARHAQALIDAKHPDAPTATRACVSELAKARQAWRKTDPERFERIRERPYTTTYGRLCVFAHASKQRWPGTAWTEQEVKLCREWIRWYDRHHCSNRRPGLLKEVGLGLQEELAQIGSRRSAKACVARFWIERYRQGGRQ